VLGLIQVELDHDPVAHASVVDSAQSPGRVLGVESVSIRVMASDSGDTSGRGTGNTFRRRRPLRPASHPLGRGQGLDGLTLHLVFMVTALVMPITEAMS
jgi:hypothetical protein